MFSLEKIVRENIRQLVPYSSARKEFEGEAQIFLDANENPFGTLNRYPDPFQSELKVKLSGVKSIAPGNIFIGNGSDEVLDLAFRIFCEPAKDKVLAFYPSYGMYSVSANINNVELIEIPLTEDFQFPETLTDTISKLSNLKMIIICSPNNPTGNTMNPEIIRTLLKDFEGIVIIDEAYIDFSDKPSWLQELQDFPNLIIMQTLSKAWALASARIGMAYASKEIIQLFNKIKPPYNVSSLNQKAAINALSQIKTFNSNIRLIQKEKQRMIELLHSIPSINQVFPSDANFLLVQITDAKKVYKKLIGKGIVVRDRSNLLENCLRITIGKPEENNQLLKCLKNAESTVLG
jgi:histidinol-phosphate aminotransferase